MERRPSKRNPKTRKKKWDRPDSDEEPKIEDEEDGMVQNAENKEKEEVVKQDKREDTCEEESMPCKAHT
jgi:hypothetical protein